jgi:hypothetical protein
VTYFLGDWDNRLRLSKIVGSLRRDEARERYDSVGELVPDEGIFEEVLMEEELQHRGAIHPMALGGEYLPSLSPEEVEIARVEFASTTWDVLSLRARPQDGRIRLRLVDEYWDEDPPGFERYEIAPAECTGPLSTDEVVRLLDTAVQHTPGDGDLDGESFSALYFTAYDLESDWTDFLSAESEFYPALPDLFRETVRRRYRECWGEEDDE